MEAEKKANPGYRAYLADGYNVTRTFVLFFYEVILELSGAARQRRRDIRPRGHRSLSYAFMRSGLSVFVRDFTVHSIMSDMMMGVPAVYACFAGYDEVAHHSGLERADAMEVLRKLDQQFGRIARARRYAARPYEIVVLSDHGQTQGATFLQRNGYGLDDLVERNLKGAGVENLGAGDENDTAVSKAVREATGREQKDVDKHQVGDRKVVVMGSGNLGLIYLMDEPRRMTMEEIDERHPDLLPALRAHPHVGWLLVRSAEHGAVALGARGANYLSEGRVEGEDPLAPFSPTAAAHLLRTDGFAHVADIMVNSFYDEQLDEGCAFEELISFHGGMGGPQTRPFLLHPVELEAPDEPIIGAEAAHRVLAGWRRRLQGDAAPARGRAAGGDADGPAPRTAGGELTLRLRPRRLNTAIAALFMIGSFGFALGCVGAYASAVGPQADAVTFFVSSIFFTTASFWQLVQSQSPAVAASGTARDDERQRVRFLAWLPRDKGWLAAATQFPGTLFFNGTTFWAITVALSNSQYDKVVWRPDFYGSILFLVSSTFAILALGRIRTWRPREAAWWVAWLNMLGSGRLHGVGDRRLRDPQDGLRGRPDARRPRDAGGRRLLLRRRPACHPRLAAGRGGRRRGGRRRGGRAHLRRRGRLTAGLSQASCFFSSARVFFSSRAVCLSASLTAFFSALASCRFTSSTQISSKTATMPDVPGGTTSSTSLAMPFSSWCLTSLPASPPMRPPTTMAPSSGGANRPTTRPPATPMVAPLNTSWSPDSLTCSVPSASRLTSTMPSMKTMPLRWAFFSASKSSFAAVGSE